MEEKDNFNVGDYIITTKSDINWAKGMDEYVGKTARIVSKAPNQYSWNKIDLDNGEYNWHFEQGHFVRKTDDSVEEYVASPAPKDATMLRVVKDIKLKKEWPRMPDIIPNGSLTWYVFQENSPVTLQNRESVHIENNRYCANISAEYFEILDKETSEEWIPKIGDVLTLKNVKDYPVVTITNVSEDSMEGCKWVKFEPTIYYGGGFRVNLKCLPRTNGYYLGRDFTVNSTNKTDTKWIPQVGDYAIMERAGGWGYHPDNNGCLAIIDEVGERGVDPNSIRTYCISGRVLNPKYNIGKWSYVEFNNIPIIGHNDEVICRKALPHEINIPIIAKNKPKLTSFPQEGCVYELPENMKDFVKYLMHRPGNRADGKIDMSEAIGIGWNHSSCWWLKTKASLKTEYSLYDLHDFLSIPTSKLIDKLPEKYPQEDGKIVIPSISPVKINVDFTIKTISKISIPDFTVEPIKVESIIVKPFKLNY